MDDPTSTNRRQLLGGAAIGGALLLAGCADQLGADDGDAGDGSGDDPESFGVVGTVDQQAMQQEQLAIQQNATRENRSQAEVQEDVAELQEEYLGEATEALVGILEERASVEIVEEYDALAAATVEGEAAAILSLTDAEAVNAIVSASEVEEQAAASESAG